jgi:hypothetical protein
MVAKYIRLLVPLSLPVSGLPAADTATRAAGALPCRFGKDGAL